MNSIIIAGIHTGIGKTIASTILVEALQYDYWKPIQAGDLQASDSIFVQTHISNKKSFVHPEAYRLKTPESPHAAAQKEGIEILLKNLTLPQSTNPIIIETAGGIMSPLSTTLLNIDLIHHLNLPVILVTNDYLGSINHTLLTIEVLTQKNIPILGLIFSGKENPESRKFIQTHSNLKTILKIPYLPKITKKTITTIARAINPQPYSIKG